MKTPLRACGGVLLLLAAGALVSAQGRGSSDPSIEIRSPEQDSYVSGAVVLAARVDPPSAVSRVTFFVDGREVCTIDLPPFECGWHAGAEVKERQIRLVANLAGGGRIVRTVRTKGIEFTQNVDVDVVQVTVTVTDESGGFVSNLPRSAFKVYEDGKLQTITHFASEDVPLELISAVDISGSMTAAMPKLKEAVKVFLGAIPQRDQVTLLGFNDSVITLTRKTTDPSERARAIDRVAAWGATALYDVLVRSVDMLGLQAGRKAVVVFTDGEDQGSHVTIEQVEARLQASDVTLYIIGQGRGVSVDRLKRIMQRLSEPTGGRVFSTNSIDELSGAFDELLEELSHQYLIGYPPIADTRDGKWHDIKVQVDGHRNVRARQGYRFAASKP